MLVTRSGLYREAYITVSKAEEEKNISFERWE